MSHNCVDISDNFLSMPTAAIIHNPVSGRFPALPLIEHSVKLLHDYGWQAEIMLTEQAGDTKRLTQLARDKGKDAVFIAGGDGSLGKAANILKGSDTILGVLPTGTANVWAQELGLQYVKHPWTSALTDAVIAQIEGDVRSIDVGVCNEHAFLLWAGFGFDAHVVASVEPRQPLEKKFGKLSYAAKGLWASTSWTPTPFKIHTATRTYENDFLFSVVTNIQLYAGGLARLDPEARVDDGKITLWAFEGDHFLDAFVLASRVIQNAHFEHNETVMDLGTEFRIEAPRPIPMQLDGEVMGNVANAEIQIAPNALKVFKTTTANPTLFR